MTEVGEVRSAPQLRVWVDALATLHGDEKRELMVSAAASPGSGTEVEGFVTAAYPLLPASDSGSPSTSAAAIQAALRACVRGAEEAASGFRAAMSRRYERDRARIEHYFEDLQRELAKRAGRGRLDAEAVRDKERAMSADRAAKLEALSARFQLRIDVSPLALRLVQVQGASVALRLRRRKASRAIELEYDAVTRRLVPPACEACGVSALRPAACDDAVHLLCDTCAPRAEGRLACPACARSARAKPASVSQSAQP